MIKKNITLRKSDVGILKSIFEGILANIKIKLRYVRCLLPAKVTVDFSKVVRKIAITLSHKHDIILMLDELGI